jgi:glycine/D-amino acid oxidase-like deaminating enzyme
MAGMAIQDIKNTPYWLDTTPAFAGSRTELPDRTDVAIVGGGLTGLSAAVHLARAGASVVVFDKEPIGWGASGRNGGMCVGPTVDFLSLEKRYDRATAVRVFNLYAEAIDGLESVIEQEGIDCDFVRSGSLVLAAKPAHYDAMEAERDAIARAVGHEMKMIPRSELGSEIHSQHYHGGKLDPREAGLHPGKLVLGLAAAADGLGVTVLERTRVEKLTRSAGTHVVHTSVGPVLAKQVLLATEGYIDRTVPSLQRRIVPVGAASVTTEPLPEELAASLMPGGRMMTDTSNLITYFRLTPDRRLLIGGRSAHGLNQEHADRGSAKIYRKKIDQIFPALADAKLEYAWSGKVGFTFHYLPHAGQRDGVHYSLGYCGHGVPMGTYMGRQMAKIMGGDESANPWSGFKMRAIPMYFGTPWFLPLSEAYYRVKDKLM